MKPFYDLTEDENNQLLLLPVYVSLQALSDGDIDKDALEAAVRFSHTKTFSCDPLLIPFYQAVDENFADTLERVYEQLPEDKIARKQIIEKELQLIGQIVSKLNQQYVQIIHQSMQSFGEHVAKAQNSVLTTFVLPMPLPGLNI